MADPDSSLTPEKKLLKLIEEPAPEAGGEKPKGGFDLASLLSPSALKGRIAYAKDNLVSFIKNRKEPIDFRQVNRVVKMITVGFGVYLTGSILYEVSTVYRNLDSEFSISPKEIAEAPETETRKLDQNLFEEVQNRNVFMPQEKRVSPEQTETQAESLRLVEITKDLKLAGISINPKDSSKTYCMVEDLKKNVTSFLKVGDSISGLRVDQISSNGIVLKHQKESIELR